MENKICLDTDFLVDFLRGEDKEVEFIKNNEESIELTTTIINLFELYYGAYKSDKKQNNLDAINLLLNRLEILNFDMKSIELSGKILANLENKGEMIEFRDLFIGVIALSNSFSVKTKNIKHFNKIEGLNLI